MSNVTRSDLRPLAVAARCLSVQVNSYRKHLESGAGSGLSRMALAQILARPLADVEEELIRLDVSPSDPLPLWTRLHHPNAPYLVNALSILARAVCEMRGGEKHFGRGAANRSFLPMRCIAQAANLATAVDLLAENVTTESEPQSPVEAMPPRTTKIANAIALLSTHPTLTNEEIAERVPCNAKYLSQSKQFKAARKAIKETGAREHRRDKKQRGTEMNEYENE